MKKTHIYLLFGLMVIAQIAASAQIVYKYEITISAGNVYKFKTAPIDPSDPFRGKYIVLNFEMDSFKTNDDDWTYNDTAYLYLSKDEHGFAYPETISKTKLVNNSSDYIEVQIGSYYNGKVHFELPFDTYYMEESKALDAELLYREYQRLGLQQEMYAVVHIENGTHVLTDVIANGVSIKDAVAK
ncbi:GDYXXLXY protein [Kordia sp. SMS9]|uniref:GDYXXLXY domain-containing protein n=1 Tax=Kordia sp. SMS9 TaxID=2282170 RepID=UPI000E0DD6A2|nr:GDYXXLXY domain-containing protein [Kordia sp. SMS9]AXG69767.1 GDYXXLXY protein [Kordia sp. SMS9]